jgi:N-acetylmuramoyl-L-alanine amidase
MCENAGNSRAATLDRTARLTAELMRRYNIPLKNVVPHQHWERIRFDDGKNLGQKNCPHFLTTNGKPGPKWDAFLAKIKGYL